MADICHRTASLPGSSSIAQRRLLQNCPHLVFRDGMCARCKRPLEDDGHTLPFEYLSPSMRLSKEFADRMREERTQTMLDARKLHLVLDLDHTLLHTVWLSELTPEEADACRNSNSRDIFLIKTKMGTMVTKMRPFLRDFLREAGERFELTIYTLGSRAYAAEVADLVDPEGSYFVRRIIASEDCTIEGRKSLDVVLARESNVLIVDDTEGVWPDHAGNLLLMEPYFYFSAETHQKQGMRSAGGVASGLTRPKIDQDDALERLLRALLEIHESYFDVWLEVKGRVDVRDVVRVLYKS